MEKIFEKLNRFFEGICRIAVLDLQKGRWLVEPEEKSIAYLKAENAGGNHILIRPPPETEPFFMLADDLNAQLIRRHHKHSGTRWKPGRMVVETSPGNYQVWIHSVRPLAIEEKRYWLKRLHSDPGADPNHRWGRCPGFRNRKKKHMDIQGGYPLARLVWVDWRHAAVIPSCDLPAVAEAPSFSPLPQGGVCHYRKNIARQDYSRGDESATDFAYALALARRNFSEQQIRDCIITERQNWQNHQGKKRRNDYICRTVAKAVAIVRNSEQ